MTSEARLGEASSVLVCDLLELFDISKDALAAAAAAVGILRTLIPKGNPLSVESNPLYGHEQSRKRVWGCGITLMARVASGCESHLESGQVIPTLAA